MKVVDDRVLDVRLKQTLKIACGGVQGLGQAAEFAAREMVHDEAGRVRAFIGLMVKGESGHAFPLQRAIDGDEVGDPERDDAETCRRFPQSEETHRAGARDNITVAECEQAGAAEVERIEPARAGADSTVNEPGMRGK